MGREEFSKYAKKLRIDAGLSQAEVAKKLKLKTGQLVSNWERGLCYPPLKLLACLSALYKVKPRDLFDNYMTAMKEDLWKKVDKATVPGTKKSRSKIAC